MIGCTTGTPSGSSPSAFSNAATRAARLSSVCMGCLLVQNAKQNQIDKTCSNASPNGKRIGHDRSQHQGTKVQKDQCSAGIQKAFFPSFGGDAKLESRVVHSGLLLLFNKAKFRAVLFSGNGSENTVCDSVGQLLWPLVNGLIGDANFFGGCCHASTKKFDCFCLFHSCGLNHSSVRHTTIVFHRMTQSKAMNPNYSERLALAMKQGACSTSALASALGVSYQAVKKVLDGKSNALTAENNAKAARFLKVSSHWLATGEGQMTQDAPTASATVRSFPVDSLELVMEKLSQFLAQVPQADRGSSSAALAALALHPEDHARKAAILRLLMQDASPPPTSVVAQVIGQKLTTESKDVFIRGAHKHDAGQN